MKFDAEKMHRMCLKKKKYRTEKFAKKMAKEYTQKFGIIHRVYWCALCGFYHLTTKEKWREDEEK